MSASEHQVWREFVERRCGIDFGETRIDYLCMRLWERMRLREMTNYNYYYHYVAFNPQGEQEWNELVELLVTKETSFFRHQPSFKALQDYVLPQLISLRQSQGVNSLNIWSACCATGEEPYSLAMVLLKSIEPDLIQLKVLGSDISKTALEYARIGRYKPTAIRSMPIDYQKNYLFEVEDRQGSYYQVHDNVKAITQFSQFNFKQLDECWIKDQDVIFCQNVLIYFRPEYRIAAVEQLCQRLKPGGFLFLGPGEIVGLKLPGIEASHLENSSVYQRI
ncbi:MAG: protein-glutamate O-methyltransferase CheR [Acidobacteriota bacterium]